MSDFIRAIFHGAGRMLDMSGASVNEAYEDILERREDRRTNDPLRRDMVIIGKDLARTMNSFASELPYVKEKEEDFRVRR